MAHKTNYQARYSQTDLVLCILSKWFLNFRLESMRKHPSSTINCKKFLEERIDLTKPKGPLKEVTRGLNSDKALQALYEDLLVIYYQLYLFYVFYFVSYRIFESVTSQQ